MVYFYKGENIVQEFLYSKITEAIQEPFVGNYKFTSEELSQIYQELGLKLQYITTTRGEILSSLDYDLLFVSLVNLAKDWISEEDAFFDYISKKLLGYSPLPSKVYVQITKAIDKLSNKTIFLLNSFTKKYYATICCHAFAPQSSMESFFDMCWNIYCYDLYQNYDENDSVFEMIAASLRNRFSGEKDENESFQVGSQVYSFRAGIKGLALDQKEMMVYLLNETIKTINSLFSGAPIKTEKYLYILIKKWWMEKESLFGVKITHDAPKMPIVISDYSQIKPKYILNDDLVMLSIPSIRLKNNIDVEPRLLLFAADKCVYNEIMDIKGSGILMATKPINLELYKFKNISKLSMKITHYDKVIYDSKTYLERDFLLFKNEKELNSNECAFGTYILYCENLSNLHKYPKEIHKINFNTYSVEMNIGDIIQTNKKTIFVIDDACESDLYFFSKEKQDLIFQYNGEDYKVIEGELYLHVATNLDIGNLGIRYGDVVFKLNEFKKETVDLNNRFLLSCLTNTGEPQKITVFRYNDNSIISTISFIKFNNIKLFFDRELYYRNDSIGNVELIYDEKNIKKQFYSNKDEIQLEYGEGIFIVKTPTFKWKIDEGTWNYNSNDEGIWYKIINNTSKLYISIPSNLVCEICVNNSFLEKSKDSFEYLLGQYIYASSMNEDENKVIVFAKINGIIYPITTIYTKEQVIDDPIYIFSESKELIWSPEYFIGDTNAKFRIDLYDKENKVFEISCDKIKEKINLSQLCEGFYNVKLYFITQGFLKREKLLFQKEIVLGNEKNIKYNHKYFEITSVMLFDDSKEEKIKPIYIDSINYLGSKNGFDYYSGHLFVKNIYGGNKYLNYMKNEVGKFVKINPVRIEMKTCNSCYLGYGLEEFDDEFEYDSEFTLDYMKKTNIVTKIDGQKTKGINYFLLEVKDV